MNLGELLGGAGVVGQSWRTEEEAQRVARQNQLAIEEQNRLAGLKAQMAQTQLASFQPAAVPQFPLGATPGAKMPFAAPTAPAAAPVAPAPAAAPATPAFAREDQSYAAKKAARAAATRPQVRQLDIDRLAMMRAPTAALDVIQAPAAAGLNVLSVLGENVVNIGGRLVNAVTGKEIAPTDVRGPRFGMTPFYDKYVREREQALGLTPTGTPTAAPAAAPAAPAVAAPTQLTQAMIQVESGGRPGAVSPKGAVGLMQVMPATAMDPGFGLPNVFDFAQQMGTQVGKRNEAEAKRLLADPAIGRAYGEQYMGAMLQKYNGNTELALAAYNAGPKQIDDWLAAGADPAKLPKETQAYVPKVLAAMGGAAGAGAAGMAPAPLEVPKTQARNMEMAEFYLAQPESIPYEQQQLRQVAQQQAALLTQQRNETARLAQIYMQSGTAQGIEAAMRLRGEIMQADAQLLQIQQQVAEKETYLQGMQGLRELAVANDPRRLAGVLSTYMGAPVGIQPRPDGNYNYFVNGKKVQDNVSPAQLAGMALKEFSPEARAATAKSAALENELALKRKYGDAVVNAMRDIQKAMVEGEYRIAEERAKQAQGKLTVDTAKGIAYFQQGNRVLVISPDGKVEEIGGVKVETGPTARQVAGLNMGR